MNLYRVLRPVVAGLAKLLFRIRVVGMERIPSDGAFVLAPSHRSIFDVFFAPLVTKRRVRFMAKRELWNVPVLRRLVEALGAFPVNRSGADRAALRTAMECLARGEPLVIFPEGTRRRGMQIEDLRDGAAYVASRLGTPIVPVGIAGSEAILPKGKRIPRLHKVSVVVGEPVEPLGRDGPVRRADVKALTDDLELGLQKAFDEALGMATQR